MSQLKYNDIPFVGANSSIKTWLVSFICFILFVVYINSSTFLTDNYYFYYLTNLTITYPPNNGTSNRNQNQYSNNEWLSHDQGSGSIGINKQNQNRYSNSERLPHERGLGKNYTDITNFTKVQKKQAEESDKCAGKYIYIQNLPRKFNVDLLEKCDTLSSWENMCVHLSNSGLGPRLNYSTGLDAGRYLWEHSELIQMKDNLSMELVDFLKSKPEWRRVWGRDHFLVAGRTTWDFRRETSNMFDWGNSLFNMPEVKNMTSLVIESSPWSNTDVAIPYPTFFHPSSDEEVYRWQNSMRRKKRPYLFSFVGAPRPWQEDSIRNDIISQCIGSKGKHCKLLRCDSKAKDCDKPEKIMRVFQMSKFCLQPSGDSYTRRSAFDAILAGCIPVFFHPGSAYVQYVWYLPKNYTSYSVFIPIKDVKKGTFAIEKRLLKLPKDAIVAMREEIIKLIPKVIYANSKNGLQDFEDAFDIAVKGMLSRVERIEMEINGGSNSSVSSDEFVLKYNSVKGIEE